MWVTWVGKFRYPGLKSICPNCTIYLSWLQTVFVWIANCICLDCKLYLPGLQTVFVWIAKCICLDYKLYLSGLQNVFVWIANCICMWVSGRRGVSEGLKMLTLVQTGSCLKEDRHTSKQTGERTYILSLPEWKQKWKNGKLQNTNGNTTMKTQICKTPMWY